ncbi:MAG: protein jag [Prochlorothrix sp.]
MTVTDDSLAQGQQWLSTLLQLAGLPANVSSQRFEVTPEPGLPPSDLPMPSAVAWLTIGTDNLSPTQIETLIGDRGRCIDAVQYLANLVLNLQQEPDQHLPFTVDINNYRAARLEALQSLAESAVQQVRDTNVECELTGLSSAERRQVHTLLKTWPDVESFSRGTEPDRRLVVCPRSTV